MPDLQIQVGSVIESNSTRYTVTKVLESVAVLRSHKDGLEARFPLDMIQRHFHSCDGYQPWMRVGVNVKLKGSDDTKGILAHGIIIAVAGGVHIRELDRDPSGLTGSTKLYSAEEADQLFEPIDPSLPRWFAAGSRVVLKTSEQVYEVKDLDIHGMAFTAFTPEAPTRIQRFNLNDFEKHWRPFSTFDAEPDPTKKPKRALAPAVMPVSVASIPTAPGWLQPGSLIRPRARHLRRSFWVMSIHPDRGMCRIQRVSTFEPLQMEAQWEELAYETAEKDWEPLNADGSPLSEKQCPHCGTYGGRNKEAEVGLGYKIRAYHCLAGHRWSFLDGGNDDGKPAPPTRFERDFDL